jgi:hypothetical protein
VRDEEIDEALDRAARGPHPVPAELLKRIGDSIGPNLEPVRPLPPAWVLTGALLLIGVAVAFAGAARAGLHGFEALNVPARVAIFGALAVLTCVAAELLVAEWTPGSRRLSTPAGLLAMASVVLLGVFALLFRDYRVDHFVSSGIACLLTGLACAAPAALLGLWVLRRGWAVNPITAGLVAGVLSGLAGVTLLELHCTNFEALHVMVWHTLVVPVSACAGAIFGWFVQRGRALSSRAIR